MKSGKLESENLKKLLSNYKGFEREDVLLSAKLGEDCSYVEIAEKVLVISTDPVTAATKNLGKIVFDINLNDISTSGANPIGVMVTILLPIGSTFSDVEIIMEQIHELALENKMAILGGHTEITDAVNRTIVSIAVIGEADKSSLINSQKMKVGDSLVVSKKLAIEGSYLIFNEFYERIKDELNKEEEKFLESLGKMMSVVKEGKAGKIAKVHMMHDVTEGGILGSVHEVCDGNNLGCILYEDKLPFYDVTRKISKIMNVDPKRLISSGAMLFSTDRVEELISELNAMDIEATVIGKITEKGFILRDKNGIEKDIEAPKRDEIYRLFE